MQLEQLFAHVREWWTRVGQEIQTGPLYIFGSTIYKDGDQFDPDISDLDLVTVVPSHLTSAIERTRWLESLLQHKLNLEKDLLVLLRRRDAGEPIISFVPITHLELEADIHKSKVRDFFKCNTFLSLMPDAADRGPVVGLPQAGIKSLSNDMVRQVLEHSQGIRNKFLALSAIADKPPLSWSSNIDPVPKELMRHAAQAACSQLPVEDAQERFDVNVGLVQLTSYIFTRRAEDPLYRRAYEWLTPRIGGRGDKGKVKELDPSLHLFFGEILYDLAAASVTWIQGQGTEEPEGTESQDLKPPTVEGNSAALPSSNATASKGLQPADCISVTLLIGSNGLLEGDPADIRASLEEASFNIKWRLKPYFDVALAELDQVQATLVATSQMSDGMSRVSRTRALDRKLRLEAVRSDLILGLQLLIYHQRIFFPREDSRTEDLIVAISSYSLLCLDPTAKATHFGGPLEAYPEVSIDQIRINKIQFGLPDPVLDELLGEQEDSIPQSWLWLAANNQSMCRIPQSALAAHFIPLLVRFIVKNGKLGDDAVEASNEELQMLCEMQFWKVGVH